MIIFVVIDRPLIRTSVLDDKIIGTMRFKTEMIAYLKLKTRAGAQQTPADKFRTFGCQIKYIGVVNVSFPIEIPTDNPGLKLNESEMGMM